MGSTQERQRTSRASGLQQNRGASVAGSRSLAAAAAAAAPHQKMMLRSSLPLTSSWPSGVKWTVLTHPEGVSE